LHDLKAVWSWAIENRLCIPTSDLAKYRAVLIIPALYRRPLVKHLLSLLLNEMGFGGAFVVQDHVAATFGAGLGKHKCVITQIS
jgi:actin-related protein 8